MEGSVAARSATQENEMTTDSAPKKPRGFGAMTPERQREIASKGGKSAHAKGSAHQFTEDEARVAGSKGGKAAAAKRKKAE
jgi:general stress protein YciG